MKKSKKNIEKQFVAHEEWFDSLDSFAAYVYIKWVYMTYGKWLYDMTRREIVRVWKDWLTPPF